jgi:RES domain-containing protein
MFSYYNFADYIRFDGRFVFEGEVLEFLQNIGDAAKSRLVPLEQDSVLHRAQINSLDDCKNVIPDSDPVNVTLPVHRMVPDPQLVGDGRLNPRGIAYLYLADSPDTAISEMRPPTGSFVTVASFRPEPSIQVVDFCFRKGQKSVWSDVDFSISIPTVPGESWRNYLPTQCIAEYLRSQGFAGVKYRSVMRDGGFNVALFNVSDARIEHRHLYNVTEVIYRGEREMDPRREV